MFHGYRVRGLGIFVAEWSGTRHIDTTYGRLFVFGRESLEVMKGWSISHCGRDMVVLLWYLDWRSWIKILGLTFVTIHRNGGVSTSLYC